MIIKQNDLKFTRKLAPRTSTESIIFHHIEASNATLEDIHRWHIARGWAGIGYNLYVRKDGTIYEGRPIWAADADAHGYNENSISVAFEGNFNVEYMTEAQVNAGIEIAKHYRKEYPTIKKLFRHKDVNPTECPGKNFDDQIILKGSATMPQHWCDEIFRTLTEKYGLKINEQRFDDKVTRAEVFALLKQLLDKLNK
jgi:hypothetical protein